MKKRWVMGLLCCLLLFQLAFPAKAAGSVYFVAAEESVLPVTDATMPFWANGYLYVPASVFTNLGISVINNTAKKMTVLEKDRRAVTYSYHYDVLVRALEDIFQRAERSLPPPVTAFQGIVGREPVPVDGKIRELVGRVVHVPRLSFGGLVLESASRSEVVAVFLAVLELVKNSRIRIEGDGDNADVILMRKDKSGE